MSASRARVLSIAVAGTATVSYVLSPPAFIGRRPPPSRAPRAAPILASVLSACCQTRWS